MDNQVFVFGSFSEDEASHFQFSSESSSKQKHTVSFSTNGNGFPSPDLLQFVKQPDSSSDQEKTSPAVPNIATGDRNGLTIRDAGPASCNGGEKISNEECQGLHSGNGAPRDTEATVPMRGGLVTEIGDNHKEQKLENVTGLIAKAEDLQADSGVTTPWKLDSDTAHEGIGYDGGISVSPVKAMAKTWASLLDTETEVSLPTSVQKDQKIGLLSGKATTKAVKEVQVTELSGELWQCSLKEVEASGKRLQPRGLINKGNLCFLNATLQALLSCSPFVHLLHTLQAHGVPQVGYPTLRAYMDFFKEFEFQQNDDRKARVPIDVGKPFVPTMFDSVLQSFDSQQPTTGATRNRQEDAQEFLSFTMDRLHEELLRLEGMGKSAVVTGNDMMTVANTEDDWETVGPKNRTAVIRTHTFMESALSDIFGGKLCSVVKTKGIKASATVQPFSVLHLDILPEAVHTVEDALKLFAAPETLEGYKTMAGKAAVVSASKSVKLQTLPRVLILHIKRFSYGAQGSSKLHKALHFPFSLSLGRDLLANTISSGSESRNYELAATVTHHGKDPSRGHYTADSKQLDGQWLRYDDGVVSVIGANRVLQDQAYLLFYKRLVNMQ